MQLVLKIGTATIFLNGLEAFIQACPPKKAIVVCNEKEKRAHGKIMLWPWRVFLQELWSGKII
ncbi:MAG: hypothetical protein A3D27_03920 [Omnitrophica WOR_2 bacterium RIFCSPHIGHO2_02_FULL_46_37]|nr:MAG: hypothetical protein A3D27_03920 [Omnitrophica WOR_2 bacterium RIFCSPHIGHO2_02_FULL_46_37]OGX42385.1 MAG: hypothetical protein A3H41_02845 [Omnitrophica WOR_2 bacterium RIFCSPLOWO2_02_FULL_45_28]